MNSIRANPKKVVEGEQEKKRKMFIPLPWILGAAGLAIAGILYFALSGTREAPPPAPAAVQNEAVPGQAQPSAAEPGKLTFSPLPLTAENDITVLYGGVESSRPGDLYEWERNGAIIPGEQSSRLKKSQIKKGDTLKVRLMLNGGKESAASVQAVVENSAPKIAAIKFDPVRPTRRDRITLQIEAADPDGDSITYTYRWYRDDGTVVGNASSVSGALFTKKETINVEVVPSDGQFQGKAVRAAVVLANALPKITSIPASYSGNEYSYQVTAEDPDKDPLTFALSKGPEGMKIDSKSGLVKWVFSEKDAGNHPVEIAVSDPEGAGDIQSFDLPLSFTTTPAGSATPDKKAEK